MTKNNEILANGINVIYAFGKHPEVADPYILFLAGTTSWNSELIYESWRRVFLNRIGTEKGLKNNIVICIPEPQFGQFTEEQSKHLIEWETEFLEYSHTHAYWLNTYWSFEQAIANTNEHSYVYYIDGDSANIGITVRHELGVSFGRLKYGEGDFNLIIGAPSDAQSLEWVKIYSKLHSLPVYFSENKSVAFSEEWYQNILKILQA